jgi:hypothetical protein
MDFADVKSGFTPDGRFATKFTVENRTEAARTIRAVHVAEARPGPGGNVAFLASVTGTNVALPGGAAWEGEFSWSTSVAERARTLGEVLLILELDEGPPIAAQIATRAAGGAEPAGAEPAGASGGLVSRLKRWLRRS